MCRFNRGTAWKSFKLSPVAKGDYGGGGIGRLRLVAYNMGQGGSREPDLRARLLSDLEPDLLFVQESRDPVPYWLAALNRPDESAPVDSRSWLWSAVPSGHWGSGLWVRGGNLTALPVPEAFAGRVVAAVVEGRTWPRTGVAPVVALSIHAPTRKGSSYIKEVGLILDLASTLTEGRPLILAGDFNVAVGLRRPEHRLGNSNGEKALMERLREEFDLVPCWQTAHPGEPLARTLRWLHRSDSLPYHCDGIFMPAAWTAALQDCTVLEGEEWCALSDHNPVVATLAVDSP